MPTLKLRKIAGFAGALCLATTLACSGGGDEDAGPGVIGGGDSGGGTLLAASFVSDEQDPGPLSVSAITSQANGNLVTVAIRATDASDVFTAGFNVNFDPDSVRFSDWAPGFLLETGGQTVLYNVVAHGDRVVVGASRTATAGGASVAGTKALILLTFRAIRAGTSPMTLTEGFLLDSQPPGPSEIPGVTWSGGQFLAN